MYSPNITIGENFFVKEEMHPALELSMDVGPRAAQTVMLFMTNYRSSLFLDKMWTVHCLRSD